MAAAAAGARSAGGLVVGVRPGSDPGPAAGDLSVVITTNLGEARNAVLVASADAVIVVGGSWGTLSELALAMRRAQDLPAGALPVVSLGGWQVLDADGRAATAASPWPRDPEARRVMRAGRRGLGGRSRHGYGDGPLGRQSGCQPRRGRGGGRARPMRPATSGATSQAIGSAMRVAVDQTPGARRHAHGPRRRDQPRRGVVPSASAAAPGAIRAGAKWSP